MRVTIERSPGAAPASRLIYHERQQKMMCGLHSINSLLQHDYGAKFTKPDLDSICHLLDPPRCCHLNRHRHWAGLGDYDVNVLLYALSERGLDGTWFDSRQSASRLRDQLGEPGIVGLLVNGTGSGGLLAEFGGDNHWFTMRLIRDVWWDLNSLNRAPRRYVDVGEMCNDLQFVLDSGGNIIIVRDNAAATASTTNRNKDDVPSTSTAAAAAACASAAPLSRTSRGGDPSPSSVNGGLSLHTNRLTTSAGDSSAAAAAVSGASRGSTASASASRGSTASAAGDAIASPKGVVSVTSPLRPPQAPFVSSASSAVVIRVATLQSGKSPGATGMVSPKGSFADLKHPSPPSAAAAPVAAAVAAATAVSYAAPTANATSVGAAPVGGASRSLFGSWNFGVSNGVLLSGSGTAARPAAAAAPVLHSADTHSGATAAEKSAPEDHREDGGPGELVTRLSPAPRSGKWELGSNVARKPQWPT